METKRCLVLMPIGVTRRKEGPTFEAIYQHLLIPALQATGWPLDIFRGDEVMRSGMSLDEGQLWLQTPHLVLADVTTQHSGVIHDLALRDFLADRTILLSQDAVDIPARFRDYRTILYSFTETGIAHLHQALDQHLRDIFDPAPLTSSTSCGE
ncbi:MAG: hypothetical protein ETSY1_34755 [Candidatus Entotheonella factor]|uniref:Uncharacterized protein n=1 Tax=Entotheonella factor TaxID=1429438 RepID=W4LAX7_ENTF1|nr:hypothetical protein [Candidatus Entotheonella palauensis]ETW94471.1 MAG: hypothetical protein ETSY1_34755 [Candidatus Entotheonella factor]